MKQKIFFAYESGHQENIDAIKKGSEEYNKHQKTFHVQTWEDLKINGSVINSCIFEAIDKCVIFACDLTYQNHNVLFELGYAIAKEKKLLVLLNDKVKGAKESYSDFKILKNIGYGVFATSKQINSELQRKINVDSILLKQLVNVENLDHNTHDVFYMNSKIESQASIELSEFFKTDSLKVISNDSTEVEYQPLIWYLKNIFKVKNIILHMAGTDKINSGEYNAEYSFFAGLGFGLGKNVLLIAPSPFSAPIDYSDILLEYHDSDDCYLKTKNWLSQSLQNEKKCIDNSSNNNITEEDKKLNLLKLGIGYEIAEEEGQKLLNYFIEYDSYNQAFYRDNSIIVGRKGSGKSALCIKLINDYSGDSNIYNVVIKPDSDELLDNVEFSKLFNNERSKKTFLLTVWKFVFLSKLLQSVVNILEEDSVQNGSELKSKILNFYKENSYKIDLNFYGVVNYINNHDDQKKYTDNPEILYPINVDFIQPLTNLLKDFFKNKKYKKIHLLCDNLDKAWDSKNDLSLQSDMILALLEFSGKINSIIGNDNVVVSTILFLRKDIYDFILTKSREPDKVTIKSSFIDWSKFPNKLKEIVEERFRYSLGMDNDVSVDDVWDSYFSLNDNKDPITEIMRFIVHRPRDIIYFVSRLFECAVNKNIDKVNEECFYYAIEEYSNFLHNNLIAEMKAEYPEIDLIMSKILSKHYGESLDYSQFMEILHSVTSQKTRDIEIVKSLFKKQYVVGVDLKGKKIINDFEKLYSRVHEKKFFFFKKNKIFILLHPRKYFKGQIKSRSF